MPSSIGLTGANPDAGGGVWTGPLVSPPGAEPGAEPPVSAADSSAGPAATYTPSQPGPENRPYTDLGALRAQLGAFQANSIDPPFSPLRMTLEG